MSREKPISQEQITFFGEKAKGCRSDRQKIEFFDSSKEAFFINSNKPTPLLIEDIPKDLEDAFYVYANMKKMNDTEFEEFKSLNWSEYPEIFKIFLFDFCISNGEAYSKYFIDQN